MSTDDEHDRTASLMTPAKLAQMKLKPKVAASPAAWLDQLASDAGSQHVLRLLELRDQLASQAGENDYVPCIETLQEASASLDRLDFSLLQQNKGLFARMTGKGRGAGADFVLQYDRVVDALDGVKKQAQKIASRQQAQAAATDRALLEFEVEFSGLEKIIDQGARWLQDMRNQLKTRQAEAGADEAAMAKVRDDAARCEVLVTRLKELRSVSSAAQQAHQQVQAAAARRVALAQALQQGIAGDAKAWEGRMAPLAAAASDSSSPALNVEGPKESQRALKQHLDEAAADCAQLQAQERSLAESVSALDEHLRAAM